MKYYRLPRFYVVLLAVGILSIQGCKPSESQTDTPNSNPHPPKEAVAEKRLEPSPSRSEAFPVTLDAETEERAGKLIVRGKTNVPDGTKIRVFLKRDRIATTSDKPTIVKDGAFESGPIDWRQEALLDGNYTLTISISPHKRQPAATLSAFGIAGNNLTGPLVTYEQSATGEKVKIITLNRIVTISGPESVATRQAQQVNLARYRSNVKQLWGELEHTKNDDDFRRDLSLSREEWFRRLEVVHKDEAGRDDSDVWIPDAATSLWRLGWEYYRHQGRETDDMRRCRGELTEFFGKGAN